MSTNSEHQTLISTREHQALVTALRLGLARTVVARDIEASLGAHHGLGLNDLALLLELRDAGGRMRRVDLARKLGITTSGVARQLGPLERIGVVDREPSPGDARLAIVVLTGAGAELAGNGEATAARAAAHVLDNLWSQPEQETMSELLDRVGARG